MISLCMIVKDEEFNLHNCLDSIKEYVDEIIVVDTGSKDRTKQIAQQFTDKVYDYEWCNNFSAARNYSINLATNDWVIILDADETVEKFNIESVSGFINDKNNIRKLGMIESINIINEGSGIRKNIIKTNRIFNKKYFHYAGIIHEQVTSINNEAYETINLDVKINHIGYTSEVLNRTNKIDRNIELLKEALVKNHKDPYLNYQLGKSYFLAKDYKAAEEAFEKALCEKVDFRLEYIEDLVETYAYSLINLNEFNKAVEIEKYSKHYSNSPDYNFVLALIYMNQGIFQKAAETFLKCTELKDGKIEGITSFLPFYNIGVIFECLGFKDDALDFYSKCDDYTPALDRIEALSRNK